MTTESPRRVLLTERDKELLSSLLEYRYLSVSQIERLHFRSEQTASRRIRQLADAGFVTTFRGLGIAERLVALASGGADVVAAARGVRRCDLNWNGLTRTPQDYLFLKHFLAAGEFRIALSKACVDREDVSLLGYIPDFAGEQTRGGGVAKRIRDEVADLEPPHPKISHTPDAVFALGRGGSSALFFLEVDRGTEVLTDPERGVAKIIRFYLSYLSGSGYHRYQAEFASPAPFRGFRALLVTSSQARLENIRTRAGPSIPGPEHLKRFLWLTTQEAVTKESILTDIWVSLDPTDTTRYAIAL